MNINKFRLIVNAIALTLTFTLPVLADRAPDVPWCKDGQDPIKDKCRPTEQDRDPDKSNKTECPKGAKRRDECKGARG